MWVQHSTIYRLLSQPHPLYSPPLALKYRQPEVFFVLKNGTSHDRTVLASGLAPEVLLKLQTAKHGDLARKLRKATCAQQFEGLEATAATSQSLTTQARGEVDSR
eukprot:s171_g16.t1